jgi:hypothetical protein
MSVILTDSYIEEQELKKKGFLNLLSKARSNSNVSVENIYRQQSGKRGKVNNAHGECYGWVIREIPFDRG